MNVLLQRRQAILEQMARIDQMEYGSLKAEYRPGPDPGHPLGPYYKYQVWRDGKNHSERVTGARVEQLKSAIAGRQQFERLAQEFIASTVEHTRAASQISGR